MQLKRDPLVIGLAAVALIAMTVLTALKVITWPEMAGGMALLGLPSVFGRTQDGTP